MTTASPPDAAPTVLPALRVQSVLGDFREIATDFLNAGDLLGQLVRRDITIRYKQAFFGFAWAVLVPMVIVVAGLSVRVALAHAAGRTLSTGQMAGIAVKSVPWAFFVGCINTTTPSLVGNMSLVTKIRFPREVLPLAAVLAQTFDSSIGIIISLLTLPFLGVHPGPTALWAPFLLFLLWLFAFSLGLLLSCANLFFRDVKYLVQVFLTFGIFVTPVLLDAPMFGRLGSRLIMLNPVAPILEGLRLSVIEHHNLLKPLAAPQGFPFWDAGNLWYCVACTFGLFFTASIIFHRAEERFAEIG